jgi:Carboxypeptidase regulatory-like domain
MKSRVALFATVSIVSSLLSFQPCLAQTTSGQISGRVADPAGQLIVHAQVTLENQLNAEQRSTTTDTQGEFVFVSVQPGTFVISVTARGFKSFSQQDVVLNASDRLSVGTLRMQIGAATQSIIVQADVTPVQIRSSVGMRIHLYFH